ncbi:MAG: DNA-processing protein DprA, partial [Bacteroidales bacterium]|nr:DNA-processing protein DprA [Bacteroidales bacterium]
RIIAGLCDLCIVIEGGIKSGSMITPRYARDFNREVLAVPGRIGDVLSEGCNHLISSNIAGMLSNFADIASIMNWDNSKKEESQNLFSQKETKKENKPLPEMSETERQIYEFINKKGKTNIDDIIAECSLDFAKTSIGLMNLELKGCIIALPGKHYECC